MANLRSGSTIEDEKIITEEIIGEHRHDADSIKGLSDDLKGESEIYAERIDDVTYETMQGRFLSEFNNTMSGPLSVLTNTNDPDAILSKGETDALFDASNIKDYSIYQLDPTSVEFSNRAILVSNDRGFIDPSWLGGVANYPVAISVTGSLGDITSGETREFVITNYDANATYTLSVDVGAVSMAGDTITYTAPETSDSVVEVNLVITKDDYTKTLSFTLLEDIIVNSFENRMTLHQFHNEGSFFDLAKYDQDTGFVALGRHNTSSKFFATYDIGLTLTQSLHIDNISLNDFTIRPDNRIVSIGQTKTTNKGLVHLQTSSLGFVDAISYEETSGNRVIFVNVKVGPDGNTYVSGYYRDNVEKLFVLKLDDNLSVLANSIYHDASEDVANAAFNVASANGLAFDSAGNVVIAGYTYYSTTSSYVGTIMVLDSDLNIINQGVYTSPDSNNYDTRFSDVAVDENDNIIACGYTTTSSNDSAPSVVVLDSNLDIISDYAIEFMSFKYNTFDTISIEKPENGIVYLSGSVETDTTYDEQVLTRFDYINGAELRSSIFRGSDSIGKLSGTQYVQGFGLVASGYIELDLTDTDSQYATILSDNSNMQDIGESIGPITVVTPATTVMSNSLVRQPISRVASSITLTTTNETFNSSVDTMTTEINSTY